MSRVDSRVDLLFLNNREGYTPPGFSRQRSSHIPIRSSTAQGQTPRSPIASPSSTAASEGYSDDLSRTSSSTAHSTAPSLFGPPAMDPTNYGYEFSCEFGFLGCNLTFPPAQIDSWISHSTSHFVRHQPPPRTCCTFCNRGFEDADNPLLSWRQRMRHIADHVQNFEPLEDTRPDFFVIEYMKKKRLLSAEDYKWAIRASERPRCDGLVDLGYKLPEVQRKEDRRSGQTYDLDKENRQRRRERDSRGKGKRKGEGKGK